MIARNNPWLKVSLRTIYNYVDQGLLFVKNIDLPKKGRLQAPCEKKRLPRKKCRNLYRPHL